MSLKFNIDRPKPGDDEIDKHKNFQDLVEQFKKQSLKKARGDESWWKDKKVRYSTVIAGATVVCTITYLSIINSQKQNTANDKINTSQISKNTVSKKTPAEKKANAPFIDPPSQKLKPPYSAYRVDNARGASIVHPSRTKIKVPKNSFVDKHGKQIVGEVTIEYKEMHNMADVIANGIPMAHDSLGKKYNLETAGMFDIRGSKDGQPVFIAPDAKLEVDLASGTNDDRFNQYYLDTIERNWRYLQKDVARDLASSKTQNKNRSISDLTREINEIIPRKVDSVDRTYKNLVSRIAAPKKPVQPRAAGNRPNFRLDGSYEEFPELSAFDNVLFEVGDENNNYSRELHEITWSDVRVTTGPVPGKNYYLNLKYRNRSEKLVVYPVLKGEDLAKAEKRYSLQFEKYKELEEQRRLKEKRLLEEMEKKQQAYLAEQKKKQEELDRLRRESQRNELADMSGSNFADLSFQAKASRLFQVGRFGVYNSDCPHLVDGGKEVVPTFLLHEKGTPIRPQHVYLINHKRKTVYNLDSYNGFRVSFDPAEEYSLCVFRNKDLFICPRESFRSVVSQNQHRFLLKPVSSGTDNISDFRKALEI